MEFATSSYISCEECQLQQTKRPLVGSAGSYSRYRWPRYPTPFAKFSTIKRRATTVPPQLKS